jgi:hypothetical protein
MSRKLGRKARRKKVKAGRRPRASQGRPQPVQVIVGYDGEPVFDCTCPVCVELMRQGVPIHTLDEAGNLVEVQRRAGDLPPMIEVVVRGTPSTWPELPIEPQAIELPVGCVVGDALEWLRTRTDRSQRSFAPGALTARIDQEPCEPERVVCAGDVLVVSGTRDPLWTRLAADMFGDPSH